KEMHDALPCAHTRLPRERERARAVLDVRSPRKRGAVTQESVGGARESGRVRSAAVADRATTDGAHRIPRPWRIRMTAEGFRASGAERKRWNAQSAGWTRAHAVV